MSAAEGSNTQSGGPGARARLPARKRRSLRSPLAAAALVAFAAGTLGGYLRVRRPGPEPYRRLIRRRAARENVNRYLLAALVQVASGGRSGHVDPGGGTGLTGIPPETAALAAGGEVSRAELLAPWRNLELAAGALVALGERYHYDPWLTLAAFRAGPDRLGRLAEKWTDAGGEALVRHACDRKTQRFVLDVMAEWRRRESLAREAARRRDMKR